MAAIPVPSVNTPTYQSWGAAVANKLNAFGFTVGAFTTDSASRLRIPNTAFGLSVITGGVAVCQTAGTADVHNLVTEVSIESGVNLVVRIAAFNRASNDVFDYPSTAGITVMAVAWGTP